MAIVAVFDLPGVTQAQYDESTSRLSGGGKMTSRADWPVAGLISHVAGPSPSGWFVADVWESKESFEQFGTVLMPILAEIGFPDVQPKIYPVHNVVTS
ncbi:hypothetical protein ABIA32_000562 [Streptacidiphilus sp. MAP12-20]|uniref:hypothetical protein n=1 Tax=Streptacidiphilus sp. MAP12-20 TaxID=3156299 RepID=UPI003514C072